MSDLRKEFERAGLLKPDSTVKKGGEGAVEKKCEKCGRPVRDPRHKFCDECFSKSRSENSGGGSSELPKGYLSQGYFDSDGYIFEDLLDKTAQEVAKTICHAKPALTQHQIRGFFGHARDAESQLRLLKDFRAIVPNIRRMKSLADDRASRTTNRIPDVFRDFIFRNVDAVKTEKDFTKGFMPHFEAVVGFCAPFLKRGRKEREE